MLSAQWLCQVVDGLSLKRLVFDPSPVYAGWQTKRRWDSLIPRALSFSPVSVVPTMLNLLKPNDIYICRTAALNSRRYILNIYSTNIHTEYFKHAAHSPFFSLQNAVYFIMLPCLVPVLFAFNLQGVLKFKCKIPASKG